MIIFWLKYKFNRTYDTIKSDIYGHGFVLFEILNRKFNKAVEGWTKNGTRHLLCGFGEFMSEQ